MKKIILFLLCFMVAFAAFAIDMSPHPGDPIETVLIVSDDVVMTSQAVSAPAVLYLEGFNTCDEICVSADEEAIGNYNLYSSLSADTAVANTGFEVGPVFNITGKIIPVYKTEFG